ncbi:MAG: crossover junction endodeoxyribonuclease RuvC [Oligoflexia bacterium]|nr:crossover junction endodeoxyribonuclease RuvC [Oligoflexia bacterium]
MGLVLGIDPGSHFTGYGLVREVDGVLRCIAFGVIEGNKKDSMPKRLLDIGLGLQEIFQQHKPDAVSIEKMFFAKNADSATKLGQARGVCLYESARFGCPIFEYAPTEIKASLVGHGRAEKEQVQFIVQALLGLPAMARFDMSDALALAIHHVRIATTRKRMKDLEVLT